MGNRFILLQRKESSDTNTVSKRYSSLRNLKGGGHALLTHLNACCLAYMSQLSLALRPPQAILPAKISCVAAWNYLVSAISPSCSMMQLQM